LIGYWEEGLDHSKLCLYLEDFSFHPIDKQNWLIVFCISCLNKVSVCSRAYHKGGNLGGKFIVAWGVDQDEEVPDLSLFLRRLALEQR
jgi:hypothetical protein